MQTWFTGVLQTVVPFVAPAEITLDADVEELRIVDESGQGGAAVDRLREVLGETERFVVTDDAPVTVVLTSVTTEVRRRSTSVVGVFRVTDDAGTVLDEGTVTAADVGGLGVAWGQRIAPHHTTAERTLYTTGSPGLRAAAVQVAAGDWAGAVETWRAEVVSGEPRNVARARHDLAVAAERSGRLDRALQLVRNADPELGGVTDRYVVDLEGRWVDAKLLRLQLPEMDAAAERPDGLARGELVDPGW